MARERSAEAAVAFGRLVVLLQCLGLFYPDPPCRARWFRVGYCYFMCAAAWWEASQIIFLDIHTTTITLIWAIVSFGCRVLAIMVILAKHRTLLTLFKRVDFYVKHKLEDKNCRKLSIICNATVVVLITFFLVQVAVIIYAAAVGSLYQDYEYLIASFLRDYFADVPRHLYIATCATLKLIISAGQYFIPVLLIAITYLTRTLFHENAQSIMSILPGVSDDDVSFNNDDGVIMESSIPDTDIDAMSSITANVSLCTVRRNYEQLSAFVSLQDDFFNIPTGLTFVTTVVGVCMSAYYLPLMDNTANMVRGLFLLGSTIIILIIYLACGVVIHAAAGRVSVGLHRLRDVSRLSSGEWQELQLCVNSVNCVPVGLTACRLFMVDTGAVTAVFSAIITYSVIILQVSTQSEHSGCKCPMNGTLPGRI